MMKVFTIYDSKAEAFLPPFFSATTATGMRAFEGAVGNPQEQLSKHPADFTLFEIGDFDEFSGSIVMHEAKRNLGTAEEFRPLIRGE